MNIFVLSIMIAEALVMLFQLRSLLQSSSADYYHPFTQSIIKLTNPILKIVKIRTVYLWGIFINGFIISLVFSIIFWVILLAILSGFSNFADLLIQSLIIGTLMTIKSFGYLLIILLLIQAITSWLPSTRSISYLFSQITYPIVAPVQKIIPPIGMIDISLMIVLLGLFAINRLMYSLIPQFWLII